MFQTTNQQKSLTSFFCTPSTQDAGALQDDGALIVVHVVYKHNKKAIKKVTFIIGMWVIS